MCCLFGILDYEEKLTLKQRQKILRVLSTECEERGTDATGIAYYVGNRLTIQKAPKPAHKMKFKLATQAHFIMGHTRMTTQGNEKQNYNNHPFSGRAGQISFTLAHNGVLYNDRELRVEHHLPITRIETDSYVAVQLLEQQGELSFQSLAKMAEAVRGSFCFTVLDAKSNLYFVKGNNPMVITHFPEVGCYLYASTQEILFRAVRQLQLDKLEFEIVPIRQGDILRIAADGSISRGYFNDSHLWSMPRYSWNSWENWEFEFPTTALTGKQKATSAEDEYFEDLLAFAEFSGINRSEVKLLLEAGYDTMDIEELIYQPDLLRECLDELLCDQRV